MNNELPFISVIVPTKNEEMHIGSCLDSILYQDYPSFLYEIIVVDNGSTDKTIELVNSYCQWGKVNLFINNGKTISSVRNFGAKHAKGDILAFLDGDSVADPLWLKTGTRILKSNEKIGCVGFVSAEPDKTGTWVEKAWFHINSRSRYKGTVKKDWLSSFNLILWRNIFEEIKGFNESLITCEDADLSYRIGINYDLIISDEIKIHHLGESKTLKEFFLKELWRGKSNLKSFFASDQKRYDFIGALFPLGYFISNLIIILLLICFITIGRSWNYVLFGLILILIIPPFITTLIKTNKMLKLTEVIQISILCFVYLIARGIASLDIRKW